MSSSFLLQQYSVCLARLIWMALEMGSKCPYSGYLSGRCFQGLFEIVLCAYCQRPCGASIQQY